MSKKLIYIAVFSCVTAATSLAATVHTVDQNRLQFSVSEITIGKGDKVNFQNSDRAAHNIIVTEGGKVLDSGLQQSGEPFEMTFRKVGTFPITCGIHPKMKMTVNVE